MIKAFNSLVFSIFPMALSQGQLPKWQFPKRQLPKGSVRPSKRRRLQWVAERSG